MILVNDRRAADIYNESIGPNLSAGNAIAFCPRFLTSVTSRLSPADVDVFMAAPKGPGHTVRGQYVEGKGVPCLIAVEQDATGECKNIALAYIAGIGGARAGIMETTMDIETETDLFGEQAVLCGGVVDLMLCGFEVLCEAGYAPENAYFEVCHEMKLIIDLINKGGVAAMNYSISDTAEFGSMCPAPGSSTTTRSRPTCAQSCPDIQDGTFAGKWRREQKWPHLLQFQARQPGQASPGDGRRLRNEMLWKDAESGDAGLDAASK